MERSTQRPVRILAGLLALATYVCGQGYTISAKPGAVNYVEGTTFLNGNPVSGKNLKSTFLSTNDTFSTGNGKAEVLLTPGVFLRVGEDTEIRMISPSLTDTKVEISHGEIMIEASGLVKDNNLQILDHGASITITKNGLYKFTADNPPTAAVLDGKASVQYDDRIVNLHKGRETILASNLATQKFDTKREDDLYAWSNVRSEYGAASSYRVSQNASLNGFSNANGFNGGGYGGYGYGGYGAGYGGGPGWLWDSGFNSYAWLPGNGVFYSPFGYGFYSPGYVGYAPVVNTAVYRGGTPWRGPNRTSNGGTPITAAVPVSTTHPPAIGRPMTASPFASQQARSQTARAFAAANVGNAGIAAGGSRGASGFSRGASAGAAGPHTSSGGHAGGGGFGGGGGHAGGGGGHGK